MHDPWINYETPCWHNPWRLCPRCRVFLSEKREYWVGRWVVEQTWGSQQTRDKAREYRDFFPPLAENTEEEWL